MLISLSIPDVVGIVVFEFKYYLASFYRFKSSLGFIKLPFPVWKYDFTNGKYIRLNVGDGKGYLMIYSFATE